MSFAAALRRDLVDRARRYSQAEELPHCLSYGESATMCFAPYQSDSRHNPHFEYIDEDLNQRHIVWFLDGVTMLNQLRAARGMGLQTFALWRLGEEDSSLWNIWDKPTSPDALQALGSVQPGHDVDQEGDGDIIRIKGLPQSGKRTIQVESEEPDPRVKLIIDEHMD